MRKMIQSRRVMRTAPTPTPSCRVLPYCPAGGRSTTSLIGPLITTVLVRRRGSSNRAIVRLALSVAALAFWVGARAQTAPQPAPAHLDSITVEAARHRELLEQQIKTFVSRVASKPYDAPLARWQSVVPICPLVAGLAKDDGEYILTRISQIAAA